MKKETRPSPGLLRSLLRSILKYYWAQSYRPGVLLGPWLNPYYAARRGLWKAMNELGPRLKGRLLDIGCGSRPYEGVFRDARYEGLELDTPENRAAAGADYFYDGRRLPFKASVFDSLLINQVLEHVFQPEEFLDEAARVLKPGGLALVSVPFAWDEHHQPWDRARYTRFGLKRLIEDAGFEILEMRQTVPGAQAALQLLAGSWYKLVLTWPVLLRILTQLLVLAPVNLLGILAAWIPGGNQDLYLDNVVLAQKKSKSIRALKK